MTETSAVSQLRAPGPPPRATQPRLPVAPPEPRSELVAAVAMVLALCLAVSFERLSSTSSNFGALEAQKAVLTAGAVLIALRVGLRADFPPVLAAYGFMVVWSLVMKLLNPASGLSVVGIFSALDTLMFLWLCASLGFEERYSRQILRAVSWSAVLSVVIGAGLQVVGVRRLFDVGYYSHVARLQGASIPSHLALLCTTGAMASLILTARDGPRGITRFTALANVLICAATATRGSLVVVVIVTVGTISVELRSSGQLGRLWILYFGSGAAVGLAAAFGPGLVDRTLYGSPTGGLNSSGRLQNWHVYWHIFLSHPLGGVGLGWLTDLSSSTHLIGNYNVPHNEYLRMLDEGGLLGTTLILLTIAVGLVSLYRRVPERERWLVTMAAVVLAVLSIYDNTLSTPQFSVGFGLILACLAAGPTRAEPARLLRP
jgi:O-antigen ligase